MKHDTAGPRPTPPPGTVPPLDWARAQRAAEPVRQAVARHLRRRRWRRAARAGAGVLVLALGFFLLRRAPLPPAEVPPATAARTARILAPERRVLPDGSVVELGREATVEIDYRGDLRHVRLTHGTAHFEVMKDPQRPFVVDAAGVGVRAVGTAFAVELARDAVEVIVTEGRVAVSDTAAASEKPVTSAALASVGAHERVVIGLASRTIAEPAAVGPEELRDRLAWRVPRLEFNGSPLGEVIALFNEHARGNGAVRLELAGDNLRALPLSGVLRADNVGALLNILESAYGLKSRAGADGRVLVYRP